MPRKSSTAATAFVIAATCLLSTAPRAEAQSSAHPDAVSPMKPNPYLKLQDPWRWDVHTQVFIRAGRVVINRSLNQQGIIDPNNQVSLFEEVSAPWMIQSFEFIYPVVGQGGHYWSPNTDVEASLRVDDYKFEPQHARMQTPDSHAPYIWWRSDYRDERAHQFHFTQISHVVCADTVFDEKLAKQIPWPDEWPEEAERFLTPIVDQIQSPIDLNAQDQLTNMVNQWLEGNDPRSIDEVTLAKFLTGKVIEHVRVGRGRAINAPYYRPLGNTINYSDLDSLSTFPNDSWSGYFARSADQVAIDPLGSVLDLSTMLTAVLRTAGVPARLLVCFDKSDGVDPVDLIRAMVEFAMYDRERDQILWIPIDPELLRDNGRRSRYYEQRWDYFGTHDRLRNFVPLAYYFQPPVNYKAYGYPGLYGLRTTPEIGNRVSPVISIDVMNSPMSGEDFMKKNRP